MMSNESDTREEIGPDDGARTVTQGPKSVEAKALSRNAPVESQAGGVDPQWLAWSLWRLEGRLDAALRDVRENERLRSWGSDLDRQLTAERARRIDLELQLRQLRLDLELLAEQSPSSLAPASDSLLRIRNGLNVLADREHELARVRSEMSAILASRSWRYTKPLRLVGRVARGEWQSVRCAIAKTLIPPARRLYRSAWIPARLKAFATEVLYRTLGDAFSGLTHYERWKSARESVRIELPVRTTSYETAEEILSRLRLETSDCPETTVVVTAYGNLSYTARCLDALSKSPPTVPYEVIVIEDASGDHSVEALRSVSGISYLENENNLGFLRSCNLAAKRARGDVLVLLNNDAEPLPGAIDELRETLLADGRIGLVGAMLLYPDGTLQEAGGIVWRDGSAWNFGRGHDPANPQYNYVRETDYCSAAAIAVRQSLWDALGGFDDLFVPAYCEDTDLAFRVRAAGLRVLFQPFAKVLHHEGVSHGTDTTKGGKRHQIENQRRFLKRWRDVLIEQHFPNGHSLFLARDRSAKNKHVVVVDHYVPQFDRDAGSRTVHQVIQFLLRSGSRVTLWPQNRWRDPNYTPMYQRLGVEVIYSHPAVPDFESWVRGNGRFIDSFFLSRPDTAVSVCDAIRAHSRGSIVYYGHDVHHKRMLEQLRLGLPDANPRTVEQMKQIEVGLWPKCDVVLYPASEETDYVRQLLPPQSATRAETLPVIACDYFEQDPPSNLADRRGVLFVAGFAHPPNRDGAKWLVEDVLPRVWAVAPQTACYLVGSNPAAEVLALASTQVHVTGDVSETELQACYSRARVAVAPLRYGGGAKVKVIEAMAHGLPIVCTPAGVQGFAEHDSILVADDAASFAEAVLRLLSDDELWRRCSAKGQAFARERFSRQAFDTLLTRCFPFADLPLTAAKAQS